MANDGVSFEDLFAPYSVSGGPGGAGGRYGAAGSNGPAYGGGGGGGRAGSSPFAGASFTYGDDAVRAKPKPKPEDPAPSLVKQLQAVSKIKAIKAVREAVPGLGLKEAKDAVEAAFESINDQLSPDPVGTLRREYVSGKYAFAIREGEYLLIDPERPAYKAATSAETAAAKNWQLLVKGSG